MKTTCLTPPLVFQVFTAAMLFTAPALAAMAPLSNPDFTKGGVIPADAKHDWTLGATGARGWICSENLSTSEARQFAITKVAKGSPADGVLSVGDVILGVGEKPFSYDPRTEFGKALISAETTSRGGEAEPSVVTKKSTAYKRTDDIIYGRKYGMALTMNLLKPANPNGAAVLWVISSGFFSSHEETLNPGFVSRVEPLLDRGYTIFLVMHASAPQFELREVNKDIHRAVRFVRSHAGDYGFDPQRIGITGSSAGGYLASWLGTTGCAGNAAAADPVERASSQVQAVACFFPGNDWMNFPNPGEDVIAISERLGTIAGFRFKEYEPKRREFIPLLDSEKVREILKELSPINHVTAQSAPMLFIFGDQDSLTPIRTQGTPMLEKLKAAGVPCDIIVKRGCGHSWPGIEKDSPSIADWFDKYLRKKPLAHLAPRRFKPVR